MSCCASLLFILKLEVCSTFWLPSSSSPYPLPLVTTSLISFHEFVCIFVYLFWSIIDLQHYISFYSKHSDFFFYIFQNDHYDKSGYNTPPQRYYLVMTIFHTLCISHLWLICFATESLCLLISLNYFFPPSMPLSFNNHLFLFFVSNSFSVTFVHLYFRSLCE